MNHQPIQAYPASTHDAVPAVLRDVAQCRAWLARIASGDPGTALGVVRDQFAMLAAGATPGAPGLEVLDTLRGPVEKLQAAAAAAFCDRAVPLATDEQALWRVAVDVRIAMAAAYEACLADQTAVRQGSAQRDALICQRALLELDLAVLDHARVHAEVPGEVWQRLHRLYRHAESHGIAETVSVGARTGVAPLPDCRSIYVHALLLHQAQPYSLAPLQMECVARWLDAWAGLVALRVGTTGCNPLTALAVDLEGAESAKLLRFSKPGPGLRHVDTERLGEKLKALSFALRSGAESARVDLATDLPRQVLERLLTGLYIQWCSAGTGRASVRAASTSKAMVTLNIPSMHFYISGRAFRQPGQPPTRQEEDDLYTFGHITQRTTLKLVSQRSSALEPWSIANESVSGMLALCREPDLRTRIGHGELLGLMQRSDQPIELVTVVRLMRAGSGELEVGVRRIAGVPEPVAVRLAGTTRPIPGMALDSIGKYERALLLPAMPDRPLPARLVLQPGWYQAGCPLDLYVKDRASVRLRDLVDKGPNYEMATFEPA
jgi:hypothetical protein